VRRAPWLVAGLVLALLTGLTGLTVLGSPASLAADPPRPSGSPLANFEFAASERAGEISIGGWAFDPDAGPDGQVRIHAYVGGGAGDPAAEGHDLGMTDRARPDVVAAYSAWVSPNSGFAFAFPTGRTGRVAVHVYALNSAGPGDHAYLGSRIVSVEDPHPRGTVTEATSVEHRTVVVRGTAWDASDLNRPVEVHAYVGGPWDGADVEGPFSVLAQGAEGDRRFDLTFRTERLSGDQDVHVYLVNHGLGHDQLLAVRRVNIKLDLTPPPAPRLVSGPAETAPAGPVSFGFVVDEAGARTHCAWDGGSYEPCTSPATRSLADGVHSFSVRAVDEEGLVGESTTRRFVVVTPVVAPPAPAGPTPAASPVALTVAVAPVRKGSRLRVRVAPASAELDYRFVVQRRKGGKWKRVTRSTTRKAGDERVLELRRGRYRVVVPPQHGLAGAPSGVVRLRR
jgi:hypothetical protein